jgi:sodium-dependent dicarboxylate transporter 2/3/5
VNSNVVALLPVAVFAGIGVLTRRDLEEINWAVLWMVAGGFALGVALNETGLAANLINSIPFNTWPVLAVLIGSGVICYTLSNFISNTATAALLVPILAVVGKSMTAELAPIGGVACLLIGIAIAASMAMVLPISTPPNALAHGTGMIEQKYMAKSGLIMGIVGLVLGYGMLILLGSIGFFG